MAQGERIEGMNKMWKVYEPWQLDALKRLGEADPERVETLLNTLWNSYPHLFEELAIVAVDGEALNVQQVAERLATTPESVSERVDRRRRADVVQGLAVVHDEFGKVARLAEGRVAVWEIVREYRKLGSVERLTAAFPWLSTSELAAALSYAEQHPGEVEAQISQYEEILEKRRVEYPFAR
jgi:uncharacterized protein (DUF433 family)